MFFQIEDICTQHTDEAIRRIIRSLPRDLPATYERALKRVVRNRNAEVARKMFRWVAAAKRPLSLMEIREAIAVEPCQSFSQQDKLVNDVYQLVPWCGNLLVLDEEEGLVQFAHHSVKDYLLSGEVPEFSSHHFRIEIQDVDHEAGEICCTYLNFSDFERQVIHFPQMRIGLDPKAIVETSLSASSSPTMTSSLLRLNNLRKARRATEASDIWRQLHLTSMRVATMWPQNLQSRYYFLAYASEYWLHHTSRFNEKDPCWSLFRRLVLAEEATLAAKPWSMEEWKAFGAEVQNYILKTDHHGLLSLAVLERLIYARADLGRVIGDKYSPQCSDELFQLFYIDPTRMVEDFWSTWDPVLIIAAERGRLEWVKEVLKLAGGFESVLAQNKAKKSNPAPAQMDAPLGQVWNSAWWQAERAGTCEMLDLLLTYKAIMLGKPEERGYEDLCAAALAGNLELTRRLLDARVDLKVVPPIWSGSFDSILAAAASGGSLEMVELLLYAGADVSSQTVRFFETTLVAAAKQGRTLIVIALLAAGADVNAYSGHPSLTPLAAAAPHEDVMVLLLLAGARTKDSAGRDLVRVTTDPRKKEIMRRATQRACSHTYPYQTPTEEAMYENGKLTSTLVYKDSQFFGTMKNYVRYEIGYNISTTAVTEAVDAFLEESLRPKLDQSIRESTSADTEAELVAAIMDKSITLDEFGRF